MAPLPISSADHYLNYTVAIMPLNVPHNYLFFNNEVPSPILHLLALSVGRSFKSQLSSQKHIFNGKLTKLVQKPCLAVS